MLDLKQGGNILTIPQFKKEEVGVGGGGTLRKVLIFLHLCMIFIGVGGGGGGNDIIMGSWGQDETDTIVTGWSDLVSVLYCLCAWI